MIKLLSRLFIKDGANVTDPRVRGAYGTLCSLVGIGLNLLLFIFKYIAGTVSGAISITADAFNNLSDAGSSVITLVGFRMAGSAPDKAHPFGHGRVEYVAGLVVSLIILVVGVELGKSSIDKVLHPAPVESTPLAIAIVAAAIFVKLYMFCYNRSVGRRISSPAMEATAFDSLSDTVATTVVLISMLVSRFAHVNIDGYAGCVVALFILYTGYTAARDTISPLLGQPPTDDFVAEIARIVLAHDEIVGIHDLVVHDYGPGRVMISLHGEVPDNGDINHLHDAIDSAEREIREKLGCDAVIHMDPIAVDDENVTAMHASVSAIARDIDPELTIHDFRMVVGPTHTNLIFDLVVPSRFRISDGEVAAEIEKRVSEKHPECFCVITVDNSYVL